LNEKTRLAFHRLITSLATIENVYYLAGTAAARQIPIIPPKRLPYVHRRYDDERD
jgi:hypothetical protein